TGATFVRRVTLGRRRWLGTLGRGQRHPVRTDDPPRGAIELDGEVLGLESQNRLAALIDHRHVDGREVDAGSEARLVLCTCRARCKKGYGENGPAAGTLSVSGSHGYGLTLNLYPLRERTLLWPSTRTLIS